MQPQTPEPAGMRRAVTVLGPSGEVRALLGLAAGAALHRGGVDQPQVGILLDMAKQRFCGRRTHEGTPCRNSRGCSLDHAAEVSATDSAAGTAARLDAANDAVSQLRRIEPAIVDAILRDRDNVSRLQLRRDKRLGSSEADRQECLEVLRDAPGVDPVMAVAEGRIGAIPDEGWLVNAHVSPAGCGVVNVYRYPPGGFETGSLTDHRDDYDEMRLFGDLKEYGKYTLAYEEPNYPHKDTDPCDRFDETAYFGSRFERLEQSVLENGGRLLCETRPMTMGSRGSLSFSMDWQTMEKEDSRSHAHVNRAVTDVDEVRDVLRHIAVGMGLGQNDAGAMIDSAEQKIANIDQHSMV